ncbi:hypothetical protein PMAYCL1PPCAC_25654, partial [Pristionchus mayeri]
VPLNNRFGMDAKRSELIALTILSFVAYHLYLSRTWSLGVFNTYIFGVIGAFTLLIDQIRTRLERIWVF